jgi:hypothetical protein
MIIEARRFRVLQVMTRLRAALEARTFFPTEKEKGSQLGSGKLLQAFLPLSFVPRDCKEQ